MKPLTVIKWLGIILVIQFAAEIPVFVLIGGDALQGFIQLAPYNAGLVTLVEGVAFGANRLKAAQELKRMVAENGTTTATGHMPG